MIRSVPGATPLLTPSEAAPEPAMVEATWVPWPCLSRTSWPGTKLFDSRMRSFTSGWVGSIPVSRTATLVPLPSYPSAHACGAPICGTESLSAASTRPSSHSLAMPSSSERALDGRAMSFQKERAVSLSAFSAAPWMLSSRRTVLAPLGVAGSERDRLAE